MPKIAKVLTDLEVKRLKHGLVKGTKNTVKVVGEPATAFHAVGGVAGLLLQITPSNRKTWILRVLLNSKRRDYVIGNYPDISLADARTKANEVKAFTNKGIDPQEQQKQAIADKKQLDKLEVAFENYARDYHANISHSFSNLKYREQWISQLNMYAFPIIGNIKISNINRDHVLEILKPIWKEKTSTAIKIRGNLEGIFAQAIIQGIYKDINPARWKGNFDKESSLTSSKAKEHQPALPYKEMPQFFSALKLKTGIAARMLEFTILTGGRSNEIVGARWAEFDIKEKVWTVPKVRMGKTKREHRVALSNDAIDLLQSLPIRANSDYVFPTPRNVILTMSNNAMRKVCIDMHDAAIKAGAKGWVDPKENHRRIVPHGFRSSFSDWASEVSNHNHEVKEMALAHTLDSKVEAAYRRGDLFQKRIALMQDWADFIYQRKKTSADYITVTEKFMQELRGFGLIQFDDTKILANVEKLKQSTDNFIQSLRVHRLL